MILMQLYKYLFNYINREYKIWDDEPGGVIERWKK